MVIDGDKLLNYLTERLVATSHLAHEAKRHSLVHIKLAQEMEALTDIIELVHGGKFSYEYEILEDAVEDFDSFINNS